CRLLLARGERVRAMVRASADPAALAGLDVEVVHGDVRDAEATARAVAGCGRVYHTAAGFLMWSRDPERDIIAASVEGTRNVVGAAARAGVEKVLYVSTGGTIGFTDSPDVILDETYHTATPHTHYFRGKVAAEKEAFAIGAREILPVMAINPGFILGPRFFKLSESVRQVADFVNRGMPFYFDGGFPVVDVEDVATGALLAMEKGRAGERYIVAGENVSVKGLYDVLGELTGVRSPTLRAPVPGGAQRLDHVEAPDRVAHLGGEGAAALGEVGCARGDQLPVPREGERAPEEGLRDGLRREDASLQLVLPAERQAAAEKGL